MMPGRILHAISYELMVVREAERLKLMIPKLCPEPNSQ